MEKMDKLKEIEKLCIEWKNRVHSRGQALDVAQANGLKVDAVSTLDLLMKDATQTLTEVAKLATAEAPVEAPKEDKPVE